MRRRKPDANRNDEQTEELSSPAPLLPCSLAPSAPFAPFAPSAPCPPLLLHRRRPVHHHRNRRSLGLACRCDHQEPLTVRRRCIDVSPVPGRNDLRLKKLLRNAGLERPRIGIG